MVARPFGFSDAYVFSDMRLMVPPGKYTVNVTVRGVGLDPNWLGAMELDVPTTSDEPMRIAVVSHGRQRIEE